MNPKDSVPVYYCPRCESTATAQELEVYDGVEGHMYHCPACNFYLFEVPYESAPTPSYQVFDLTPDEIRYAIHSLGKQAQKVENARRQVLNTITKLEIMLEVAKEKENN